MPTIEELMEQDLAGKSLDDAPAAGDSFDDTSMDVEVDVDDPIEYQYGGMSAQPLSDRAGLFLDDVSWGFGQYPAALGAGFGGASGAFEATPGGFLEKLGAAAEEFPQSYETGQKAYNLQMKTIEEQMPLGERLITGLAASLPTAGVGGPNILKRIKDSKNIYKAIAGQTALTAATQAALGYATSREDELKLQGYDALVSGGLGAALDLSTRAGGKAWEMATDLVGKAYKRARGVASEMVGWSTDIPPHLLEHFIDADPKEMKSFVKQYLPENVDRLKEGELDAVAQEIIKGIREDVTKYRQSLKDDYTKAIKATFGNTAAKPKHLMKMRKMISDVKKEIGYVGDNKDKKEALRDLLSLEKLLHPRKYSREELGPLYAVDTGFPDELIPERLPQMSDLYEFYDRIREIARPGFMQEKDVLKPTKSKYTSRIFKDMLKGDDGVQNYIRALNPQLADLDAAYTKMYALRHKLSSKLQESARSKAYLERAGKRGPEALDLMALQDAAPQTKAQDLAEKFSTASVVGDAKLDPQGFGKRQGIGLTLGMGADIARTAVGIDVPTMVPYLIGMGMTFPKTGKLYGKAMRGTEAIVGPTKEFLERFGGEALTNPNFQRILGDEFQKRLERSQPKSPFDQ